MPTFAVLLFPSIKVVDLSVRSLLVLWQINMVEGNLSLSVLCLVFSAVLYVLFHSALEVTAYYLYQLMTGAVHISMLLIGRVILGSK